MEFNEYKDLLYKYVNLLKEKDATLFDKKIKVVYQLPDGRGTEEIYFFTSSAPRFCEIFSYNTGFYLRTGVLDENWNDTGLDPDYRSRPQLLDIGIINFCKCADICPVHCYQGARKTGKNMSFWDYKKIIDEASDYVFQVALGGSGNPTDHEDIEQILKYTNKKGIKPNFTDSGLNFTEKTVKLIKEYCGACAISAHPIKGDYSNLQTYTKRAIEMLIKAGVKTNIHWVLSKDSISDAIRRLKEDDWPKGLNAVVFLLYKDVGLGVKEKLLSVTDPEIKEFFSSIDNYKGNVKIGFDACSICGVTQFLKNIDPNSVDSCEAMRHTMYIDAHSNMMACSFANQMTQWHTKFSDTFSIKDFWFSDKALMVRSHANISCPGCKNRQNCKGGCPILPHINLCNKKEKQTYKVM